MSGTDLQSKQLLAPFRWQLVSGLSSLPLIRFLGTFCLIGLGSLCALWLLAMTQDVQRGGRSPWVLVLCLVAVAFAWLQIRSAWIRWHVRGSPLQLIWSGPVRSDPPSGGWRTGGHEASAAKASCVFDFQSHMLCRVRQSGARSSGMSVHWCWVKASTCPDFHRLRTLLMLPTASMNDAVVQTGERSSSVASSASMRTTARHTARSASGRAHRSASERR